MESKILAAQEFAAKVGEMSGNQLVAQRLEAMATFRAYAGDGFLPDNFVQQVKFREVRVPGPLNFTSNLTVAATTAFADFTPGWTYQNPTDRFCIVWAAGYEVHNIVASAAGTMPADGPIRQLRSKGSLTFHPPYGKQIQRSYAEHDLGPIDINVDTITTLVGAAQAQRNLRERLQEMVVDGVPLFVLAPNDTVTTDFGGLSGVTVGDSVSGVQLTQYFLCEEYVMA